MTKDNYPIPLNLHNSINSIEFPAKDIAKLK